MKKLKKSVSLAMCAVMLLTSGIVAASAAEPVTAEEPTVSVEAVTDPGVEPKSDTIVWKYRMYNGQMQKRRWNETKQVWVDPYWINI
ncbi:MAG: hypothetical protein ACI4RP_06000 [Acutalibacteraceae bacterium]